PLAQLAQITNRFAAGDFTQRAEAQSRDEIGMLAQSFNQMAEELSTLYRSLEQKVDERTRQIHTAAEVAQRITSTAKLDELLNRTVQLIVDQFAFYQASIFMIDQRGRYAVLQAAHGPAAREMLSRGHRLEVGSASIIGWVTANRQPRVASDVSADPIHFKNELLPHTRSEVGIPIMVGNLVLGALDVQSVNPDAFGPDTVVMLQLIASQIAVAIQNVGLVQSTQVNFQDLERLQRASREVVAAHTRSEALKALARIVAEAPYASLVISIDGAKFTLESEIDASRPEAVRVRAAVQILEDRLGEISRPLTVGAVVGETESPALPSAISQFARQLGYQAVAFLPVLSGDQLAGVITMGAQAPSINTALVQPYANLADLTGTAIERITESSSNRRQLEERQALSLINQAISETSTDFEEFFKQLHEQVRHNIGDYAFIVALYDKSTASISIPYMYEEGHTDKVEAFPLGEGMTSVLIRTARPLMLVENVERRAAEMGAKTLGRPARSWMGAPMMIRNEPIGALIVQDLDHEHAFNEDNLGFFVAMANQVAAVIHNARLLEESRARTVQLETAAEIARDVSGSLNLDELLAKSVGYIRERFDFYHASIFLLDPTGEYAVIRESTGEAGAQMKRLGHKLQVGSKSIVGYVSSQGEPLVVNDTSKDATYLPHPLLPHTQAEAALPLKVGERVVGVLDVQSSHPFAFSPDSLRALRILADQLGVAVVNSELFAETQEHLSQHRLLHHITTSAASGTTLEEALESAVTGLQVTLGGDRVSILLVDAEKKNLEVKAAAGYSEDILQLRIALGAGVTGWAAQHHRALRVDNVADDPRYIQASANTASELAIPLVYRNEVLGVLNAESEQPAAYSQDDEEMLGTLGGSLAAIIANARLLEQIRAQAERERLIYDITSKIRRSTNIETILSTTASELTRAVGARRAQIKILSRASSDTDGRKDGEE
ncbi:MAG: GAF domain-containing protein, partial [Anaerolineae bacterium]